MPGALARVHIEENKTMVVKKAFIVKKSPPEGAQLSLFPSVLVYLLHSNTLHTIFESQILEVLSLPW